MQESTPSNEYTLSLDMLLDYLDGSLSTKDSIRIDNILEQNDHIKNVIEGIMAYYHQYGENRSKLLKYLSEAQKRVLKELFSE